MSSEPFRPARVVIRQRYPLRLADGREITLRARDDQGGGWIEATPLTEEEVGKVGRAMAKAGRKTGAFRSSSSK